MADMVNHPRHYAETPFGIEVIEITRHFDFDLGNALKYILRAGKKNLDGTANSMMPIDAAAAKVQDLKKAVWYIQDEIGFIRSQFEGIDLDDPWAPQKDEGPAFDERWCVLCDQPHDDTSAYDHEVVRPDPIAVLIDGVVVSTTSEPAPPAQPFSLDNEDDAIGVFLDGNPMLAGLLAAMKSDGRITARRMSSDWEPPQEWSDDDLASAIEAEFKKS